MRLVTDQVTADEVRILLRELKNVTDKNIPGDIVELGCYEGGSAVELQRLLVACTSDKTLWLYDSFEGLPAKTKEDQSPAGKDFHEGVLKAAPSRLKRNFVKAGLPLPEIRRAWFYELDPEDLPEKIALAFLDGDFYESIMDSLKLVWPKMSRGGVIIVDDYKNAALPGVARAVNGYAERHDATVVEEKSLGIIRF